MNQDNPSVGRIVHFINYGTPNGEYHSTHIAGIITAVRKLELSVAVDICVFYDNGLSFKQSVPHDNTSQTPGTWHWPERS